MDEFTRWDLDIPGAGLYTAWDAAINAPTETKWDLMPAEISRTFEVVWRAASHAVRWVGYGR